VPLAVAADGIHWSEGGEEMVIELFRRGGGVPARAGQVAGLLVHLAVIPLEVIRLENQLQVIGYLLISKFRESARAAHTGHVITSFWAFRPGIMGVQFCCPASGCLPVRRVANTYLPPLVAGVVPQR
jgi:hypothetical protein